MLQNTDPSTMSCSSQGPKLAAHTSFCGMRVLFTMPVGYEPFKGRRAALTLRAGSMTATYRSTASAWSADRILQSDKRLSCQHLSGLI